jgi:hypothetical protein
LWDVIVEVECGEEKVGKRQGNLEGSKTGSYIAFLKLYSYPEVSDSVEGAEEGVAEEAAG